LTVNTGIGNRPPGTRLDGSAGPDDVALVTRVLDFFESNHGLGTTLEVADALGVSTGQAAAFLTRMRSDELLKFEVLPHDGGLLWRRSYWGIEESRRRGRR
jgi:hypothetical protein